MRGGKIIHYHGWADPALTAMMSVNYYESVRAKMGESETEEFYKMYMVPGMFHCGGGPGPNTFDVFTPLKNWVENGVAPEKIIATNPSTEMTRPLCPYPEVEVWDGVGDPYVAESFDCGFPEEEDYADSD